MKGEALWHIALAVARRVVPLLLAAILGAAVDVGLLDRRLGEALCGAVVDRPSVSCSNSETPVLLRAPSPS